MKFCDSIPIQWYHQFRPNKADINGYSQLKQMSIFYFINFAGLQNINRTPLKLYMQ